LIGKKIIREIEENRNVLNKRKVTRMELDNYFCPIDRPEERN